MQKVTVICSHADTTKHCVFYVTDLTDSKILLGLTFCKAFNLVKILCDNDCICKKIMVDVLNEFPKGLDIPKQMNPHQIYLPPVDINTKLRSDCKTHIMELFPRAFRWDRYHQGCHHEIECGPKHHPGCTASKKNTTGNDGTTQARN